MVRIIDVELHVLTGRSRRGRQLVPRRQRSVIVGHREIDVPVDTGVDLAVVLDDAVGNRETGAFV